MRVFKDLSTGAIVEARGGLGAVKKLAEAGLLPGMASDYYEVRERKTEHSDNSYNRLFGETVYDVRNEYNDNIGYVCEVLV